MNWHDASMTLVIAHRGASHSAAENTLAAFELAGTMGADGVELDVRRTKDWSLIVHHDPALPDGRVIVELSAEELPASVPTLAAALDACGGMFVNVEIKNDHGEPDFDPDDRVIDEVAALLAQRGGGPRWLVSSFRIETIDRCRAILPEVRTAWLTYALGDREISAVEARHDAIHPYVELVDEAGIRAAHLAGLAVNTWTCDDPVRMRELIGWGIDGICTNVPDVALAVRRNQSV